MNRLDKVEEVLEQISPRFMASNPWRTIDDSLESLVDKVIYELNPDMDDTEENMNDWDNRLEAINYLVEKLVKMKG